MSTTPNPDATDATDATDPNAVQIPNTEMRYAVLRKEATVTISLPYAGCTRTLSVETFTQVHPRTRKPVTAKGILFVGDINLFREVCADTVRLCEENDALEREVAVLRAQLATRQEPPTAQAPQAPQ